MSEDDVLFGYRLQLIDLAGRIGVSAACRTFGVHRSTYYRWKRMIERHGLEILRPRERRYLCFLLRQESFADRGKDDIQRYC